MICSSCFTPGRTIQYIAIYLYISLYISLYLFLYLSIAGPLWCHDLKSKGLSLSVPLIYMPAYLFPSLSFFVTEYLSLFHSLPLFHILSHINTHSHLPAAVIVGSFTRVRRSSCHSSISKILDNFNDTIKSN